jgi:hypothetical protein
MKIKIFILMFVLFSGAFAHAGTLCILDWDRDSFIEPWSEVISVQSTKRCHDFGGVPYGELEIEPASDFDLMGSILKIISVNSAFAAASSSSQQGALPTKGRTKAPADIRASVEECSEAARAQLAGNSKADCDDYADLVEQCMQGCGYPALFVGLRVPGQRSGHAIVCVQSGSGHYYCFEPLTGEQYELDQNGDNVISTCGDYQDISAGASEGGYIIQTWDTGAASGLVD